ncbi:MAG: hypothetical protein ABSF23_13200 [Terracidiphilus sp.]|jgi:hypothetical protein
MPEQPDQPKNKAARRTDNDRWTFGHLRSIGSACQHLQERIEDALQDLRPMPAAQRSAYIARILNMSLLNSVEPTIATELKAIDTLFSVDVTEFEWAAAEVTSIRLRWEQIKASFALAVAASNAQEEAFKDIVNYLDNIVYYCISLTLSPWINDVLKNLRVGQPLDVEFEFGKQFPKNPTLRKELILEIAQESSVIEGGVVDLEHGVIYKASPTRMGQLLSAWRILGFLILGGLLTCGLAFARKLIPDWPFAASDLHVLLVNYLLILLGSGAHLAVAALQTSRKQTRPSFQALNDWVLWIHVREAQIFKGIAFIWLGFLLLSFSIHNLSWIAAFFGGYSIDSVTELFLGRFETTVAAKTKLLTKALE